MERRWRQPVLFEPHATGRCPQTHTHTMKFEQGLAVVGALFLVSFVLSVMMRVALDPLRDEMHETLDRELAALRNATQQTEPSDGSGADTVPMALVFVVVVLLGLAILIETAKQLMRLRDQIEVLLEKKKKKKKKKKNQKQKKKKKKKNATRDEEKATDKTPKLEATDKERTHEENTGLP